jgi:hypothetical protein
MSSTDEAATEQCRALTNDGNRCQNSATGDGFCHQHDESDPTVDDPGSETTDDGDRGDSDAGGEEDGSATQAESGTDTGGDAGGSDSDASDQDAAESDAESDSGSGSASDADADADAEGGEDEASDDSDDSDGISVGGAGSLMDVRETVQAVTARLIDHPLDGVVEITKVDDEWRATVEVIERRSVPDTQDILGRYELTLDDPETVTGYRRISRYRRSDTDQGDSVE